MKMVDTCDDSTGVRCSWCPGEIVYNGHYFCSDCGRTARPTAEMYSGLFDRRYPKGDFESHLNFDRKLYDRGKREASIVPELPIIYCWITGGRGTAMVQSLALAEDGTILAGHVSSSETWARGDCGYLDTPMGRNKRAAFANYYPKGYLLEWIENPETSLGLALALGRSEKKNQWVGGGK